jgi:hypothetical protein
MQGSACPNFRVSRSGTANGRIGPFFWEFTDGDAKRVDGYPFSSPLWCNVMIEGEYGVQIFEEVIERSSLGHV